MGFAGTMSLVTDLGFTTANVKTQAEGKDIAENNGTFLASRVGERFAE